VRPLSHEQMEVVTGGGLQIPPIHGGPVPIPPPLVPIKVS
jgi:hypothetical protein